MKTKFDNMMVIIGEQLYNLQLMLGDFSSQIIEEFKGKSLEVELKLPFNVDNDLFVFHCNRIYFDPDDDLIKISVIEKEEDLALGELDLASQEIIANFLLFTYSSNLIYERLSSKNEIH